MTEEDRKQFSGAWISAWEACGKTPTGAAVMLAYNCLKEFDLGDVVRAIYAHLKDPDTGQYPVKPADVVLYLGGSKGDLAALAFRSAMQAASTVGGYESVVFSDPLTAWTIHDMGGWQDFCLKPLGKNSEQLPFLEREFCAKYQAHLRRPPHGCPKLIGVTENSNSISGYAVQRQIMIGSDGRENTHIAIC